jgi:hypothetical protein
MEPIRRPLPKMNSKLSEVARSFLNTTSGEDFIRLIGRLNMEGRCGYFGNYDGILPEGKYIKVYIPGSQTDKVVIRLDTFEVFTTRSHYRHFVRAGRLGFCQ